MAWAKFDDRWDDNRKVKKAWRGHPRAVAIHAMAITYCARHELDGLVDVEWLHEKLPVAKDYREAVKTLVDAGLFVEVDEETFRVHDFLKYNPSKEQLEGRREADRQRKATGGRKDSKRNPSGIPAESDGTISDSGSPGPARPGPARPVPSRPSSNEEEAGRASAAVPPPPAMPKRAEECADILERSGVVLIDAYFLGPLTEQYPDVDFIEVAKAVVRKHRAGGLSRPGQYLRGIVESDDPPKIKRRALAPVAEMSQYDRGTIRSGGAA